MASAMESDLLSPEPEVANSPSSTVLPVSGNRWSKFTEDQLALVLQTYKQLNIPDGLRNLCQEWFESRPWIEDSLLEDGERHTKGDLYLKELEENVAQLKKQINNRYSKAKFTTQLKELMKDYKHNPSQFVLNVARCIEQENSILGEDHPKSAPSNHLCKQMLMQWRGKCGEVRSCVFATTGKIDVLREALGLIEKRQLDFNEWIRSIKRISTEDKAKCAELDPRAINQRKELQQKVGVLEKEHLKATEEFGQIITEGLRSLTDLLSKLDLNWRNKQKEELITGLPPPPLADLQELYELTANEMVEIDRLLDNHHKILQGSGINPSEDSWGKILQLVNTHKHTVSQELEKLIRKSFIFDQLPRTQSKSTPPGNIRATNAKFECSVRTLLPAELYGKSNLPSVRLFLVKEEKLSFDTLFKPGAEPPSRMIAAQVHNGKERMQSLWKGEVRAHLKHLQLREKDGKNPFKRPTDDSRDVRDMRYALLARCTVTLDSKTIYCDALAYPVVVTVQSSQDADALASLFWFSAFGAPMQPEQRPEPWRRTVSWKNMSDALHYFLRRETERGLTEQNKEFLYTKFLPSPDEDEAVEQTDVVTWNTFNKEKLVVGEKAVKFTPWKWFLGVTCLIKQNFKEDWKKGNIVGFIRKTKAEELLKRCVSGTFLIRFSETQQMSGQASAVCGRAALTYLAKRENSENKYFIDHTMLKPEDAKNLSVFLKNCELKIKGNTSSKHLESAICVNEQGKHILKRRDVAFPPLADCDSGGDYPSGRVVRVLEPRECDAEHEAPSPTSTQPGSVQSHQSMQPNEEDCYNDLGDFLENPWVAGLCAGENDEGHLSDSSVELPQAVANISNDVPEDVMRESAYLMSQSLTPGLPAESMTALLDIPQQLQVQLPFQQPERMDTNGLQNFEEEVEISTNSAPFPQAFELPAQTSWSTNAAMTEEDFSADSELPLEFLAEVSQHLGLTDTLRPV